MAKQYNCIGMGGTFDHLHRGHRGFIEFAAGLADTVVIGVTDHSMTQHKLFPQLIEPFADRVASVKSFCRDREIKAEVVALHDIYGPATTDLRIVALAVTEETVAGGAAINLQRKKLGLLPLPVHVFSLVLDATGVPITSTRIRAGEIDREGLVYAQELQNGWTLTEQQRTFFAKSQGSIIEAAPKKATAPTYVVGDVCLANFHGNNWEFHAGWFDGKTHRKQNKTKIDVQKTHTVTNASGQISAETTKTLLTVIQPHTRDWSQQILPNEVINTYVVGEEDLCAVALVLLVPLGSLIYYGQPNQGMVVLKVTEELKKSFSDSLLNTKY